MIESGEIKNYQKDIDLSELFTARNLYIEKAKRYILSNGTTLFEAGGLAHDVLFGIQKYGAIPNEFYHREKAVNFSDHSNIQLDAILKKYLRKNIYGKNIYPKRYLKGNVTIKIL